MRYLLASWATAKAALRLIPSSGPSAFIVRGINVTARKLSFLPLVFFFPFSDVSLRAPSTRAINLPLTASPSQSRTWVWPPRSPSRRTPPPTPRNHTFLSRFLTLPFEVSDVLVLLFFFFFKHQSRRVIKDVIPSAALHGRPWLAELWIMQRAGFSTPLQPYSLSWKGILMGVFHSQLEEMWAQVVQFVSVCLSPVTRPPTDCNDVCYNLLYIEIHFTIFWRPFFSCWQYFEMYYFNVLYNKLYNCIIIYF